MCISVRCVSTSGRGGLGVRLLGVSLPVVEDYLGCVSLLGVCLLVVEGVWSMCLQCYDRMSS